MEIILGVVVTLLVQGIKKFFGTSEYATLAVVLVLSVIAAALNYYYSDAAFWRDGVEILLSAGGIYALLIERFKTKPTT